MVANRKTGLSPANDQCFNSLHFAQTSHRCLDG